MGERTEGGALIVRQILTTDANAVAEGLRPDAGDLAPATPSPLPGMSLGSTLVADSPRALYRRAYDRARRRADGDSPRERLSAMDDDIAGTTDEQQMFLEE